LSEAKPLPEAPTDARPDEPPLKPKLLIVDDDEAICTQMKWAFAKDYDVMLAGDRARALEAVRGSRPPVVTLDLGLPPRPRDAEEGFQTLSDILAEAPGTKVIVITGQGEKQHALKAIGETAYDFLTKPVDLEELQVIVRRAFYLHHLETEHRQLLQRVGAPAFEDILGASATMEEVFSAIRKVAATDVPVLIRGETGTGKELIARAIHRRSLRPDGPFVAINCGAIPENLLESELFGHEKGAFTGAHARRKGRIELAERGTLFLDEIGELPPPLQVKLLRFLQEHQIERVGGRESLAVDTRVLAASNIDFQRALKDGRFREDLYYRIAVVVVSLPPLRAREGDVLLLANAFLRRYAAETQRNVTGFTPSASAAIEGHAWPGNVRELENRIKRAVVMAEGAKITPQDLELAAGPGRHAGMSLREAREAVERELVHKAIRRHRGNLSQAATELGISRPTLYELMEKLAIERGS
jgi:two-component system NtrC family response regulator